MSVSVRIPTVLRAVTAGQSTVDVEASTVREVVKALDAAHPGMAERVLDENGQIRRFVNLFVDDEDVRFAHGLDTTVRPGGTVSIIPAVAGGG